MGATEEDKRAFEKQTESRALVVSRIVRDYPVILHAVDVTDFLADGKKAVSVYVDVNSQEGNQHIGSFVLECELSDAPDIAFKAFEQHVDAELEAHARESKEMSELLENMLKGQDPDAE